MSRLDLKPRLSRDGTLQATTRGWRLGIPAGGARSYRLAQLDDQAGRRRSGYLWRAPLTLRLRARVSQQSAAGTWGFGLWNDPYGFSFGPGEHAPRLPTMPQAAWFFCASPRCFLSFRDDKPANGFYAQALRSRGFGLRLLGAVASLPFAPRRSRKILSSVIEEDGAAIRTNDGDWHSYQLDWSPTRSAFYVDDEVILQTPVSPREPLGLVIWIDNQYAAFDPEGHVRWGVEANPTEQWLEVEDVALEVPSPDAGTLPSRA